MAEVGYNEELPDSNDDTSNRGKLSTSSNKTYVPINDSCANRPLTNEEKSLNIKQNSDNLEGVGKDKEFCNATNDNNAGAINTTENCAVHLKNDVNKKLWNIIQNLDEDELFEDPDFPIGPKALFFR